METKMDRESSLQNWNAFTRPKDKTILSFSGSPRQWPWQGCCCNLPRESNAVRRSCVPPHPTDIAPPSTTRLRSLWSAGLSGGSDQHRIRGCGPDSCLLGRIHFPCGYVCLWCMCFCVAEVFLAKHSYNASHNLVLPVYLNKCTLLCFSLGYTDNFIQGYSWMEQLLR